MQVNVIEVLPKYSLVEYDDIEGYIQRRLIPQGLYRISRRGPAFIPDEVLMMSMDYSNVDLVSVLGEELTPIRVRDLQDALRRAGLWTQKDYNEKSNVVSGVWQRLRGVDVTAILNAAFRSISG